ncbi:MAG: glycosyltransferase family 4 protein [Aquisalimonadaceae bacterium]
MRVLILAPHPFYQDRGTPIAVNLLIRALTERGDTVDILTFHEGSDPTHEGLTIHRIAAPLFGKVRNVRPGPSWKKIVCDVYLMGRLFGLLRRHRYDVIHAVEESAFMAMVVGPLFSVPFIFDIDSSLTTQVVDKYRPLKVIEKPLRYLESLPARRAVAVLPVCQALATDVARYPVQHMAVLKDVSLLTEQPDDADVEDLRATLEIDGTVAMYIGNLEPYQGIDLLLESFAEISDETPDTHLVVIGGEADDINHYRKRADTLRIGARTHFIGKRPVARIGAFMAQAQVLVSPRLQGVNTPMKVYTYLHSGIAVLATDLPTHTQVMTDDIACLAPPEPSAFGMALRRLINDPELRARLAHQARDYIEREHSYPAFKSTLYGVYDHVKTRLPNADPREAG